MSSHSHLILFIGASLAAAERIAKWCSRARSLQRSWMLHFSAEKSCAKHPNCPALRGFEDRISSNLWNFILPNTQTNSEALLKREPHRQMHQIVQLIRSSFWCVLRRFRTPRSAALMPRPLEEIRAVMERHHILKVPGVRARGVLKLFKTPRSAALTPRPLYGNSSSNHVIPDIVETRFVD